MWDAEPWGHGGAALRFRRDDWVGDCHLILGPKGNRGPWDSLEQRKSKFRHRYLRLQAAQSVPKARRLGKREPELSPRLSEVGLFCKVTSPSSRKPFWL